MMPSPVGLKSPEMGRHDVTWAGEAAQQLQTMLQSLVLRNESWTRNARLAHEDLRSLCLCSSISTCALLLSSWGLC